MLALLGVLTIAILLALLLSDTCSPMVALILVSAGAGLAGGFGSQTAAFMVQGISNIATTAAMLVFAMLFFGMLTDAGMLDPIIGRILRAAGANPVRIVMGSALLALLIHLDGSGAICFLVAIPAMLPVYERLRMDPRVLACVVSMAAGVNFLPWTGPTVRAAAALHVSVMDIFRPMIAAQGVGLIFTFTTAWWLGHREACRLKIVGSAGDASTFPEVCDRGGELGRPRLFWINMLLTAVVMTVLIGGVVPPVVAFMGGTAIVLLLNYPGATAQRERVEAHARAALTVVGILLAAGCFTGVMSGTGALQAIAQLLVTHVPAGMGTHIPFALSLVAMPLSLLFDPDSFYFSVMPVIAELHSHMGGQAVQVAQAALVGQMTAGFPVSPLTPATFLVAGLSGIGLSSHQKFSFPFLYGASIAMAVACVVFGVFPA